MSGNTKQKIPACELKWGNSVAKVAFRRLMTPGEVARQIQSIFSIEQVTGVRDSSGIHPNSRLFVNTTL
jgi:hypothetical protein